MSKDEQKVPLPDSPPSGKRFTLFQLIFVSIGVGIVLGIAGVLFGIFGIHEHKAEPAVAYCCKPSPDQNVRPEKTPQANEPASSKPNDVQDSAGSEAAQEPPTNDESRRIDPPREAPAAAIANILRQTGAVTVDCGKNVDIQTCKFFVTAFSVALRERQRVSVLMYYDDPQLGQQDFLGDPDQSFFIPPRLIPFLSVTLRLIENGPPQSVRLFVSGFCFAPDRTDYYKGLQLPIWMQEEGGNDYGPLEGDKARAASKLAQTFAAYWGNSQ